MRISKSRRLPDFPPLIGIVNGTIEWLFAFPDRLSVTISGADRLLDVAREDLAQTIWAEVAKVTQIEKPLPPWQIIKEKRATFAATVAENARRPGAGNRLCQSTARGRLDGDRPARDDRRRDPVRPSGGGLVAASQ